VNHVLVLGFGLLTICFILGCGPDGPEMGKVEGTVTLDGVPVTEGTVQFWPTTGRPARGSIGADGTYQLSTFKEHDGAYVGQHAVTIKSTQLANPGPQLESQQAEIEHFRQRNIKPIRAARVVWVVPRSYSQRETSPLTATVESGANEINFEIGAEKK
jgi:hypothetical protein